MTLPVRELHKPLILRELHAIKIAGVKVWSEYWKRNQVKLDRCVVCGHEPKVGDLIGHNDDSSAVVHLRCLDGVPRGRTDS